MNDASTALAALSGTAGLNAAPAPATAAGDSPAGTGTGELAFIAILDHQMRMPLARMGGLMAAPTASPFGSFRPIGSLRQSLAASAMGLPPTAACGCGGLQSPAAYGTPNMRTIILAVPAASLDKLQASLGPLLQGLDAAPILTQPQVTGTPAADSSTVAATDSAPTTLANDAAFPTDLPVLNGIQSADELGSKLAENLTDFAKDGYNDVSFSIEHPLYGRIETRVAVDNDQVSLSISSDDPQLRSALELATDSLRQNLSQQGMTLAAYDVTPTAVADAGTGTPVQSLSSASSLAAALSGYAGSTHPSMPLLLLNSIA
jgi:hypothetical protein